MAQTTMYQGINNSPKATLTAGITAADQVIPISDASFFPDGPNIATIGVEDDAELIRYAAKSGNTLIGCERGFHGTTAKVWNQSDVVYRGFTLYDHDAFRANIGDLAESKLDKTGDGSNATVGFTAAASRVNVATGEKLSVLFGKVAKWLADIKALAFKATVSTSDIDAAAVTNTKLSNMAAGTLKGNNAGASAAPVDIDAAGVRTMLNVADGADVTRTIIEEVSSVDALADADELLLNDASAEAGSKTKTVLWSAIKSLLSSLYAPFTHASRHAVGGTDAVSPSSIGAAAAAAGVPTGGTSGQVLTREGEGFGWADASGGGAQSVDNVSPDVSGNVALGAIRYNVDQSLTDAQKAQARANIGLSTSGAYGVRWNSANSSPLLTRLGASAQFADPVAALGAGLGSSPFDSILPWSGMRECNRASNAVTAYKGDANFSRSNDTYVEIPKFYYKCTRDGNNHDYYISSDPAEGFVVHPAFIVGGVIRDNIYVGRYNTVAGHVSKTNTAPLVSITRASFRSGAAAKGANNSQFTVAAYEAIKLLYLVEYANWNIQATIGYGHTNTANTAAVLTGKTDMMLYHTGTSASSRTADSNCNIQYRWIEGLYGNVWQFLDGVNVYADKPYYNLNCTSFADDTSTGYTATSYTLGSTNGYVTALGFDPANPWLQEPVAVGGSETTYLCDYFYQDASGWRLVIVGGNWSDGLHAGFYWSSSAASSFSRASVGGRLLAA